MGRRGLPIRAGVFRHFVLANAASQQLAAHLLYATHRARGRWGPPWPWCAVRLLVTFDSTGTEDTRLVMTIPPNANYFRLHERVRDRYDRLSTADEQ